MTYNFTNFNNGVRVEMSAPERSIDEMCEYFQRFLTACGYVFENNEKICCVPTETKKSPYSTSAGDVLSFNTDGSPFVYDFGNGNNMPCIGDNFIPGAWGDDTITFDKNFI